MIRVWIDTPSEVTRAGFEALLDGDDFAIVESAGEADVIIRDGWPEPPGPADGAPVVVLSDEPLSAHALGPGVMAVLPRSAPLVQITAALIAASAGLVTMPAASSPGIAQLPMDEISQEVLTPRETEVLEMLAEGLSNKEIAARLNISDHTAKFHVNSILSKLRAGTRTEAVMRGIRRGLVKI